MENTIFKDKDEDKGELVDLGGNVFIFPVVNVYMKLLKTFYNNKIQIPSLKHKEDETILTKFLGFQTQSPNSLIRFASGYMNLGISLTDLMVKSTSKVELLTAAPKVNN